MPAINYSEAQREYWAQRPYGGAVLKFGTVEFSHPDFGFIRLVGDVAISRELDVNGTLETFQGVAMEMPGVTNQTTDTTQAGTIVFGRIGTDIRRKLMEITPLGAIRFPITTILRQYQNGVNIYERKLYVNKDGVSINADTVNIRLSVDNPAKLSNETAFYNPDVWIGLSLG